MRRILLTGLCMTLLAGCHGSNAGDDAAPSPARVPGPYERRMDVTGASTPRPLPDESDEAPLPPPPFNDVPLVSQEAPETPRYVEAYEHVGRPRIVVWVSRPEGTLYDEAAARAIDYAAIENILIDWLAGGGRVAIISPEAARQGLSPQEVHELNGGRPGNAQDVADRLKADVLVLVRAEPTRQGREGPAVRMVAEASNLKGAESIGRAVVDVPAPLDKPQINKYTRFVARKLMADITTNWNTFGNEPAEPAPAPPPATAPIR